jgi:hypothetical protein
MKTKILQTSTAIANTVKTVKNNYYKPTPVKWRKIGDAIQDAALIASGILVIFASPPAWIPAVIFAAGRIGKIITNFTTE